MPGRLAIVGGDAAGMSAATNALRTDPDHEVVAFERGEYTSYSACGIPYYVGGLVDDLDDLVARSPEEHRRNVHLQLVEEPGSQTLLHDVRSARDGDVFPAGGFPRQVPHAQRLVKPAEPLGLVAPGPDGRVALPDPLDELTRLDHPPAFPPCNRLLLAANGA